MSMKVMLIGDIVGKSGLRAVQELVPRLRQEFHCCFCIANGENMAGGAGLSGKGCHELKRRGVDVITGGDHMWDNKDFIREIQGFPYVLRPLNLMEGQPGKGAEVYTIPIGGSIAVVSLLGQVFMKVNCDNPFSAIERILDDLRKQTTTIFVDIHGEATSEKVAMGRYLDGRVTAVFGTHTHVPTADEKVLPNGTAYMTDLGMVGGEESILGRAVEPVVSFFSTGLPSRFNVVKDDVELNGAVVEYDQNTGCAISIERFRRIWKPE